MFALPATDIILGVTEQLSSTWNLALFKRKVSLNDELLKKTLVEIKQEADALEKFELTLVKDKIYLTPISNIAPVRGFLKLPSNCVALPQYFTSSHDIGVREDLFTLIHKNGESISLIGARATSLEMHYTNPVTLDSMQFIQDVNASYHHAKFTLEVQTDEGWTLVHKQDSFLDENAVHFPSTTGSHWRIRPADSCSRWIVFSWEMYSSTETESLPIQFQTGILLPCSVSPLFEDLAQNEYPAILCSVGSGLSSDFDLILDKAEYKAKDIVQCSILALDIKTLVGD